MVLPASLAAGVRGLVAGSGRDARPSSGDVHFHVSAMDGNSVKSFFKNNRNHVAEAVKSAMRDGRRLK